jgi:hypothetical protein
MQLGFNLILDVGLACATPSRYRPAEEPRPSYEKAADHSYNPRENRERVFNNAGSLFRRRCIASTSTE